MIKTNNITVTLDFEEILKKTKSLKTDTIYPYQVFGASSDKLRVYISDWQIEVLLLKWHVDVFINLKIWLPSSDP